MKIVEIREISVPLKSSLRNSVFDFSEMTTSVVAVISDVIRSGKPLIGYAFNSTGRYACGEQMRSRLIPRILSAEPDSLLDNQASNIDPAKVLARMMLREKPGGHGAAHGRPKPEPGPELLRGLIPALEGAPGRTQGCDRHGA